MMYGTVTIGAGLPAIENRATEAGQPGGWGDPEKAALAYAYDTLGFGEQWREGRVDADVAMTYSAFWACIRVIAQSLAGVGWHGYERQGKASNRLPLEDDTSWLLGMQASPEMSAFDFVQVMLKDALVFGNGVAEIERKKNGQPLWMWYIDAPRVNLIRDDNRRLFYEVDNGPGEEKSYLSPENVFHLRGLGPDGLVGWSVIEVARRSLQLGLAEERFGVSFFSRGPMPGGILEIDKALNETQRREYRRSFEEVYGGARNAHRIVVLSAGMKFNPAVMPNEDMQFLQSRRFQVSEMARFFGVPPHKLADLERATFSNVEEQERAFVTDCLLPWARRLESEADIKLFGRTSRGRRYTRFNLDALLRGNSITQTEAVVKKVASAIVTPNEGRELFDMNPIEGGDELMIQGAMVRLKDAGKQLQQKNTKPSSDDEGDNDNSNGNSQPPERNGVAKS